MVFLSGLDGKLVLFIVSIIFLYYITWVFSPFILLEDDNLIHKFFGPLNLAFAIPVIFGVLFISSITFSTLYYCWNYL